MAAQTTIGTLNFVINGNSAPAIKALGDLERGLAKMPRKLEGLSPVRAGVERDTKKYLQAINQLSYGIEDFAAVIGTTGLSGALRASSNNLSQFFRIIMGGTAGGAIAGVAVGLGSALIPILTNAGNEAENAAKQLEKYREGQKALQDHAQQSKKRLDEATSIKQAKSEEQINTIIEARKDKLTELMMQQRLTDAELRSSTRALGDFELKLRSMRGQTQADLAASGKGIGTYAFQQSMAEAVREHNLDLFGRIGQGLHMMLPSKTKRIPFPFLENGLPIVPAGPDSAYAVENRIKEEQAKNKFLLQERKKLEDEMARYRRQLSEAELQADEIMQKAHAKDLAKFLETASSDTEAMMGEALGNAFSAAGRKIAQTWDSLVTRGKRIKEQEKFESDLAKTEVAGIAQEEQRKIEDLKRELDERLADIRGNAFITPEQRRRGIEAAEKAAQRETLDVLKDAARERQKSRVTSAGTDFADRNTMEGARRVNEAILRATSANAEEKELMKKQTALLDKLLPAIQKLNDAIKNPANKITLQSLNLQGSN